MNNSNRQTLLNDSRPCLLKPDVSNTSIRFNHYLNTRFDLYKTKRNTNTNGKERAVQRQKDKLK